MSARVTARAGLLDVLDRPLAITLELLWRWLFGALALIFIALACVRVFSSASVSDADQHAIFLSGDPQRALDSLLRIMLTLGPKLLRECAWLLPLCCLLYWLFSTAGRALTLAALSTPPNRETHSLDIRRYLRPSAALQTLRVLAFCIALALDFAAILAAARLAPPDFADFSTVYRYYGLLLPLWLLIAVLWAIANFALAIAPATLLRTPLPVPPLRTLAHRWNPQWLRVTWQFAVLKTLAFTITVSAAFITAGWAVLLSWYVSAALLCFISLLYFAVADILFLARLAAFSRIGAPTPHAHEVHIRDV